MVMINGDSDMVIVMMVVVMMMMEVVMVEVMLRMIVDVC